MTGYGRYEHIDENRKIVIDLRSVNHRYCDIFMKMPRRYSFVMASTLCMKRIWTRM